MKKSLSFLLISSFVLLVVGSIASAKNIKFAPPSEEAVSDGLYDVEGHPELKVRVHVHQAHGDIKSSSNSIGALVCNIPDPDSSSVTPKTPWHLPSAVTYRLNTGSVPAGVGGANLATISGNAFSDWSFAVGGKISFTRDSNTSTSRAQFDLQNIIAWGRTSNGTLAVTYTWYYPSTGTVAETDTIFNSRYSWAWADQSVHLGCAYSNAYDAEDILTHETGHWMGLDDTYTSPFTDNTMFGYGGTGETKKDTLTTGDIAGVNLIYP